MATKYELAHRLWPYLVEAAGQRNLLTYGELAEKLGFDMAILMGLALDPIYHLCIEKGWPNLSGIVVNASTGRPGSGFDAWEEHELEERWEEVFQHDWSAHPRPFSEEDRKAITLAAGELDDFLVPDVRVETNGRGPYQEALRRDVLRIYGGSCALCNTRLKALLVASHIVPWAQDPENRRNPQNAILLCRTHDALFEIGVIRITPDLEVEVVVPGGEDLGEDLQCLLRERTAQAIKIATGRTRPDAGLLRWRYRSYPDQRGNTT